MSPHISSSSSRLLAGVALVAAATVCQAQESSGPNASGSDIGRGDTAKLRVLTPGFHPLDKDGKPDLGTSLCAPANAVMIVDQADATSSLSVRFEEPSGILAKLGFGKAEFVDEACADIPGAKSVKPGRQYVIERNTLDRFGYNYMGWVYGPLVIPYKFNLHDRTFTGSPSVAAYVGQHANLGAIDASMIVASGFGLTTIQTTSSTGVVSNTTTPLFTLAMGVGLTLSKKGSFQIGVLAGKDWAGRNRNYEHEGKTWIALSFGSTFGR